MGIWGIFQKTEQNLRKRIETALNTETTTSETSATRQEVLEKIQSEIRMDTSGSSLPSHCENRQVPEVSLFVVRGAAEQSAYRLKKERIFIGRASDVTDREGRIIRKNDVVFLDNGETVNATVEYSHARIWWDFEEKNFFLMDEASRYGICIVRQGHSLEVSEDDFCKIPIQAGDDIYCGQACFRFNFESVN